MSLTEALDRGKVGRLWHSRKHPSFVTEASDRGALVLDSSSQAFAGVIRRLPQIIDLDELADLKPTRTEELPSELVHVERLIKEIDRVLLQAGFGADTIMPCLGFDSALCRDVDLTELGLGADSELPPQFVALQAQCWPVLKRAELARVEPALAAYMMLDMILAHSHLLSGDAERIRHTAAMSAFEEYR